MVNDIPQGYSLLYLNLEYYFNVFLCLCDRDKALEEVCHKLCVCNAVRDALEGGVPCVSFHQLLLNPSKNTISFLLEVYINPAASLNHSHCTFHSLNSIRSHCKVIQFTWSFVEVKCSFTLSTLSHVSRCVQGHWIRSTCQRRARGKWLFSSSEHIYTVSRTIFIQSDF